MHVVSTRRGPSLAYVWRLASLSLAAILYSAFLVSEDPEAHLQALQKLIDSGVTHIFVHSPQADQAKVVRFYGERVLPMLSQAPLGGRR